MNLFRTAKRADQTPDYAQLARQIRDRRKTQRREPGQFPSFAEPDSKLVRAYRPADRLDSIDERTQQLVKDTGDIPRKWDCDWSYTLPRDLVPSHEFEVILVLVIVLGANLLAALFLVETCTSKDVEIEFARKLATGGIGLAVSSAMMGWYLNDKLPPAARISWFIAGAEAVIFIALLYSTFPS